MKIASLPPSISACIPTINWPLNPASCPPLYYEPLDRLVDVRSKTKDTHPPSPIDSIASDVPSALSTLLPLGDNKVDVVDKENQKSLAKVSLALLLLGNGFVDEAHDLVTPLSWPEPTHFGYGPSLYSTSDANVVSAASYVHSLVHRREGWNVGEYGMTGLSNANYWTRAAMTSRGSSSLPLKEVRKAVLSIADDMKDDQEVQKWTKERVIEEGEGDDEFWEPRALHELCGQVLKSGSGDDKGLRTFAQRAAEAEVHVLLRHCFQSAGFDYPVSSNDYLNFDSKDNEDNSAFFTPQIDETIALASANKLSSAHENSFRTNGSVTIRGVVKFFGNDDERMNEMAAFSAMAGIAARLLNSPACCSMEANMENNVGAVVRIMLPVTELSAGKLSDGIMGGGGSLTPGDVYASIVVVEENNENKGKELQSNKSCYDFVACKPDDSNVAFVDKLYGKRGETPTTVVQWSKGTIF